MRSFTPEVFMVIYMMSAVCVLCQFLASIIHSDDPFINVADALAIMAAMLCPVINTAIWIALTIPSLERHIIWRRNW